MLTAQVWSQLVYCVSKKEGFCAGTLYCPVLQHSCILSCFAALVYTVLFCSTRVYCPVSQLDQPLLKKRKFQALGFETGNQLFFIQHYAYPRSVDCNRSAGQIVQHYTYTPVLFLITCNLRSTTAYVHGCRHHL